MTKRVSDLGISDSIYHAANTSLNVLQQNYEEIGKISDQTNKLFLDLQSCQTVKENGLDDEMRPKFISVQSAVEAGLAKLYIKNKIKNLQYNIHYDKPANAFITDPNDVKASWSIKFRASHVRENVLPSKAPVALTFAVDALNSIPESKKDNYFQLRQKFENIQEHQVVNKYKPKVSGSTHLFQDQDNQWAIFWIRTGHQTEDGGKWEMGLTSVNDQLAHKRLLQLKELFNCRGPQLPVAIN
ncbi:MAG: hypothetical protein JHC93_04265 [Parachlamydiales bacterium]|nr:hypothetical protein [Parachlamydiales bacterium]